MERGTAGNNEGAQGQNPAHLGLLWVNHFAVSPSEGGGTRHYEMARELTGRGWRVELAASDLNHHTREFTRRQSGNRDAVSERVGTVQFRWLWASPYERNDWRRAWNWLSFARSLWRERHSMDRPDVVIGSSPHLFAALAAERLARRWNVPFVFEVRDLWPESIVAASGRRGLAYYALAPVAKHLYRQADQIMVLAEGVKRYLSEAGITPEKVTVIPNGVDPSAFDTARTARNPTSPFTLSYIGAHGPANGLETVLAAAAMLRDRDVRFSLVGDGPVKAKLQTRARQLDLDNLEFRDPVPKHRIPEVLAEADAGLMVLRSAPLFSYGVSPNKLFDYFAARLPVVCNVPGEVARYVAAAGAGVQAEDSSAEALVGAVETLLERSETEREVMGQGGRRWVEARRSRDRLADRLDAVLKAVVTDAVSPA